MNASDARPDYAHCSLYELVQILNVIVPERAPSAYTALLDEIDGREALNAQEAQSCWNRLDRERFPELANRLAYRFTELEQSRLDELARTHGKDKAGKPLPPPHRTFGRRVIAGLIDTIILLVIDVPLFFVFGGVAANSGGVPSPAFLWAAVLTRMLYFILMHGRFGWTLGKRIMGLEIVSAAHERRIGYAQALARHLDRIVLAAVYLPILLMMPSDFSDMGTSDTFVIVVSVFGLVGAAWILADTLAAFRDEKHRSLHDRIGRTVVRRWSATR